jgi:hypothetical protein
MRVTMTAPTVRRRIAPASQPTTGAKTSAKPTDGDDGSVNSLNAATDALNRSLAHAEARLRSLAVEGEIPLLSDANGTAVLRFAKSGSWRLELVWSDYNREDATPLLKAAREHRLLAAEKLPELVASLRQKHDELLTRAQRAIQIVNEAVSSLPDGGGPPAAADEEPEGEFSDDISF